MRLDHYEGLEGTWLHTTFRPYDRSFPALRVGEFSAVPRPAGIWGGAMIPRTSSPHAVEVQGLAPARARFGAETEPKGVVKGSRVRSTPTIDAFVNALWERVKSIVPGLFVTSGDRLPEDQARAMLAKALRKDAGSTDPANDLLQLYSSSSRPYIQRLLASGRSLSTWTRMIAEWEAQGVALSDHQGGNAVDIDDQFAGKPFTLEQVKAIQDAAKMLGAKKTLLESIGKKGGHIHIEDLPEPGTWSVEGVKPAPGRVTPDLPVRPSPGQVFFIARLNPGEDAWLQSEWLQLETHSGEETDSDTYDLMWRKAPGYSAVVLKHDLEIPEDTTVVLDTTDPNGPSLRLSHWT